MEPKRQVETRDLEHKIAELQKNLSFVNQPSGSDSTDLLKIIHFPGWTTLRAVNLAGQMLDAMNQQAVAMEGIRTALQEHVQASVE